MQHIVIRLLSVLFVFTGCSTLSIHKDYDTHYDFSKVKTFTVLHKNKAGENTLVNDRIITAINKTLIQKGFKQTDLKKADLVWLFHINVTNKTDIRTDYQMVGFYGYGYSGGMVATTSSYNYDEGKLILDAVNPKSKKIVYRVVLTDEIDYSKTPQESQEYILKAIQKALKDFPPKK